MDFLFKSYLHITVLEYVVFILLWALVYYNLRSVFPGSESFVISLLLILVCMFGQYITEVSLQLGVLQWFDSLPFMIKWLPLAMTAFFTSLIYEKDQFWRSCQVSGLISIVIVALIYLII